MMLEQLSMRQIEPKAPQPVITMLPRNQIAAQPEGLSQHEVLARRAAGQGNTAPAPTSRTYRQIVVENVFTFINSCLFCLGMALALLGRPLDALISTGVIALNILVSVVQEIRAKRTLDRIALLTRPTATVIRDGQACALPPEQLVVGDLLTVGPGDQIVVDGTVIGDGRMQVDESQLTGESQRFLAKPERPVRVSTGPRVDGREIQATDAGVVPAVDRCIDTVAMGIVLREALLEMELRGL